MDILVTGRQKAVGDTVARKLDLPDVTVHVATDLQEVTTVLHDVTLSHVFIGPGLDTETRLEIVGAVLHHSETACVHLKDTTRGPEGALDFIRGIVTGLRAEYHVR